MTSTRQLRRLFQIAAFFTAGLIAVSFGRPVAVFAAPTASVPAVSVTIPAGGSATLQVRGLSYGPGSTLSGADLSPAQESLPADRIRTTLFYGINWGYAESNPDQVALAVWYAQNSTWLAPEHEIADRIANAAQSAAYQPVWNVSGRSLTVLAGQGQVTLASLRLTPVPGSNVAGTGTLQVTNTSAQELSVYLPYGTLFGDAGSRVLVWATGADQTQPPIASTPAPTSTVRPAAPTATTTAATGYKPGYTPSPEPTSAPIARTQEPEATPTAAAANTATALPSATADPRSEPPVAQPTSAGTDSSAPAKAAPAVTSPQTGASAAPGVQQKSADVAAALPRTDVNRAPAAAEQPENARPAGDSGKQAALAASEAEAPVFKTQSAPPPVNATPTKGSSAPAPVSTGAPSIGGSSQPSVPLPQQTIFPTLPPNATATPTGKTVFTPTPTPTEVTKPIIIEPGKEPTKAAEPAPQPAPLPEGPVIITGSDSAPDKSTKDAVQSQVQAAPLGQGPRPSSAPVTGGGGSGAPVWLALLSAVMVLGGWSLRRTAGTPAGALVSVVEEQTER